MMCGESTTALENSFPTIVYVHSIVRRPCGKKLADLSNNKPQWMVNFELLTPYT